MLTVAGWVVALAVGAWLLTLRFALGSRMELVARACHELRGPLTVARLGLELAARDGELRPEALRAIDLELASAAVALASAAVALEDLSSALAGRIGPGRLAAVDVSAMLGESVEAFRPLALARGVDLDLRWQGEPAVVYADRVRLAQATGNLIANALEHGDGNVELLGRSEDGRVEIEVADDGPGLPAPVADLVTRARGGRGRRGRGLAIAADIARCHGGRLAASGEDGGGSRLALLLPLRRG